MSIHIQDIEFEQLKKVVDELSKKHLTYQELTTR